MASSQEFELYLRWGGVDSVTGYTGVSSYNLSTTGWTIINPFDAAWKYNAASAPEADGETVLSDNKMAGVNMTLLGGPYGDDPDDLQSNLSSMISKIHESKGNRPYFELKLWNGASLNVLRRYAEVTGIELPMARKTRLQATQHGIITARAHDPGWYENTVNLETVTVVAGTGFAVVAPGGNLDTHRVTYKIIKDGADDPTNPTITTTSGYSIQYNGSLTNVNDYWLLDTYHGTLIKSVSGTESDDRLNMSGEMLPLTHPADVVTVTDTLTSDFKCEVRWLAREQ